MSEYQRFVSYIYEYQNHTRLQNCGFAKVEVRNSRCRLQIHMKLHAVPFTPVFQVYAFIPSDGQHIAVLLGKAAWQQGVVSSLVEEILAVVSDFSGKDWESEPGI